MSTYTKELTQFSEKFPWHHVEDTHALLSAFAKLVREEGACVHDCNACLGKAFNAICERFGLDTEDNR